VSEYDVFLSHYSGDAALAGALERELRAAGLSVWYDGAEIRLGDSILAKMQEGLQKSHYGLILFTPGFLSTSTGFRWGEVEAYLAEQLAGNRTQLLPLVAGVEHVEYQQKMPLLRARRYERIALNKNGRASRAELHRVVQVISDVATLRTLVQLVGREELNSAFGGLEGRLVSTRKVLMASGNDCKELVESRSGFLARALDRGVEIKIMCVDPHSPTAVETLIKIDERFDEATDFIESMKTVENVLTKFRTTYPNLFEFRYTPIAPSVGLYISDPGLPTALMKVEMYTPKPWNPLQLDHTS
jgi:hypothetical protein